MENEELIRIDVLCRIHNLDTSFIWSLNERGLVELTLFEEIQYIHSNQLTDLERMIRLHTELEINLEGIEAVGHLLQKVQDLSSQVRVLQNRMERYEGQ